MPELIEQHSAVSPAVSRQMAIAVLRRTPTAHYAAAITGHLGPGAPISLDGRIFMAVAARDRGSIEVLEEAPVRLTAENRTARQLEAARSMIQMLTRVIR